MTKTAMDGGTLIGCMIGGLLIIGAAVLGGPETIPSFWNTPALLIVFGGTAAALFIAYPLKSIRKALRSVRKCLVRSESDPLAIAAEIVSFAESTRRTGLLAQESRVESISDPFLAEGFNLIIDGLPPSTVENILTSEIEAMQQRHQLCRNIVLHCGKCAPAFGMIGTLIGLVLMLTNLDAETVGPGMAVAVLTTLYGILAANLVFLPIAEKLKQLHDVEMQIKAMIVRGVLAVQSGEHPRIIQRKLLTFLPPGERPEEDERISASDVQTIPMPQVEEEVDEAQAA
ncbi:MAG: MotA/TolQ/ExbB proton channel family protein [Planctomycetaceae bacterium]|jgi:chemotaxis protein MotA|nr:MotA/TolQ/ExbB proton channel family protein [Planctomycetaceae bacterium]